MFQNYPVAMEKAATAATGAITKRIGTLSQRQTLGGTLNIAINSALGRSSYKELGLDEYYPSPEFPAPVYDKCETNISTLSNGMRVVSRVTNDPITNIGVKYYQPFKHKENEH